MPQSHKVHPHTFSWKIDINSHLRRRNMERDQCCICCRAKISFCKFSKLEKSKSIRTRLIEMIVWQGDGEQSKFDFNSMSEKKTDLVCNGIKDSSFVTEHSSIRWFSTLIAIDSKFQFSIKIQAMLYLLLVQTSRVHRQKWIITLYQSVFFYIKFCVNSGGAERLNCTCSICLFKTVLLFGGPKGQM